MIDEIKEILKTSYKKVRLLFKILELNKENPSVFDDFSDIILSYFNEIYKGFLIKNQIFILNDKKYFIDKIFNLLKIHEKRNLMKEIVIIKLKNLCENFVDSKSYHDAYFKDNEMQNWLKSIKIYFVEESWNLSVVDLIKQYPKLSEELDLKFE